MVALRTRPKGGGLAPFGLLTVAFALLPAPIGTQDLGAMFSYRAAANQAQPASHFSTLHVATFRFPQPPGTAIPRPAGYRLASLTHHSFDLTAIVPEDDEGANAPPGSFPRIDRRLKGDSLLRPAPASPPAVTTAPPPETQPPQVRRELVPATESPPVTEASLVVEDVNVDAPPEDGVWPQLGPAQLSLSLNPTLDTARLYFGDGPLNAPPGLLDRTDLDQDAAVPIPARRPEQGRHDVTDSAVAGDGGHTIAGKGEVTGEGKHPLSPAERLGLTGKARAKAERCLANAVYFESRGESVRGQIAVAQVVMNRVFHDFYPNNVCGVVYQNAHRRNACQFTFACDGVRDVVTEPDAWVRAKRIAKDTLDGKLWLNDVGKATHYHAYWVRPWWIRTMRKLDKIGVHTFYRPRKWGDGSDEPVWGDAKITAVLVKKL
jgi:spore germination cell wall hydrolase CwlJ-like protein